MIRHKGILCLIPFLIPLAVVARPAHPPAAPGAPVSVQVPINTQFVGSDGVTYVLSGTLTLAGGTITPPPPDLRVSYLTMAPAAVTAGQSALVSVQMSRAAAQAASVALTSSDPGAQVPALLTIPAGADKASASVVTARGVAVERLAVISARYGASGGYSSLRVLPDQGAPAASGGPVVGAYLNADGSPLAKLVYGQEIRITGQAFGPTPGQVLFNGGALPVIAWSDTEVRVRLPLPEIRGGAELTLVRPDGLSHDVLLPLDMPARVPGSVRRR